MMKKGILLALLFALLLFSAQAEAGGRMLSADGSHILALDANGCVWAWGSNQRGESVPGDARERVLTPEKVLDNISCIAAGQRFSMAVDKENRLYMWGDNQNGQIPSQGAEMSSGIVPVKENVRKIDACDSYALALTLSGEMYVWGGGSEERLIASGVSDAAVGIDFALALMENGDVYEYPLDGTEGKKMLSDASCVDASGESRYALLKEGSLYAWGANGTEGRLGVSSASEFIASPQKVSVSDPAFVRSGLTCGCAVDRAGSMYAWGTLYAYFTGYDSETGLSASLMDGELIHYGNAPIRLYEGVEDAAFGDAFCAILFENGDVYVFGTNDQGQIGNGSFSETAVVAGEEEGEYELTVLSSAEHIFPACPIRLEG